MSLVLPPKIYTIYNFFEKTKNPNWQDNPFINYKKIYDVDIKIAKSISNLNFYQVDFPIDKSINPSFLIKYIENIDYRNLFSSKSIVFKKTKIISNNQWIEEEYYNNDKNIYTCISFKFQVIFYTDEINKLSDRNVSQAKYYNSYKILNNNDNYILRFETVFNHLDIDQEIDLQIYINMILNLLKTIYQRFKVEFKINDQIIEPIIKLPKTKISLVKKVMNYIKKDKPPKNRITATLDPIETII